MLLCHSVRCIIAVLFIVRLLKFIAGSFRIRFFFSFHRSFCFKLEKLLPRSSHSHGMAFAIVIKKNLSSVGFTRFYVRVCVSVYKLSTYEFRLFFIKIRNTCVPFIYRFRMRTNGGYSRSCVRRIAN